MVETLSQLPELQGLESRRDLIRIPPEVDVPVTPRVRAIIDTAAFRRLASISQLGLVSLVYPAAHHRRFEHSLGVYRLCLAWLAQFAHDARFAASVSVAQAEQLLLASLLHDVAHWPFCHIIEDMQLPGVPPHEALARDYLMNGELADVIRREWRAEPSDIADLLEGKQGDSTRRLLGSILSGPIDIDKMDYLSRDSLHAGVPYGRNFDQARLIGSLCLNEAGDGLAITSKGRTAAEMMVFARYVMFSEVYWHHAVRAATAMFQRAFFSVFEKLDLPRMWRLDEHRFVQTLLEQSHGHASQNLVEGLFGSHRRLYKRWLEYSYLEDPQHYQSLTRLPYARLVDYATRLATILGDRLQRVVLPEQVLIDAPPTKLEVQFNVDIFDSKRNTYHSLLEISPVVRALAETQFDDYVKRVRVFLHPEIEAHARTLENPTELLQQALATASGS